MTDSFAGQTVETARRALTARLRSRGDRIPPNSTRGCWSARRWASISPALIAAARRPLTADESTRLEDFARRRLAGEPVARILGLKEFWGLPLQLSAATLVPRPDTETVVELALEMLRAAPLPIAGCASPTSAPAQARFCWRCCPNCPMLAASAPTSAWRRLRTASSNAVDLGFTPRAAFVACDYAAALSGAIRSDRVEPALYPLGGHRRSRHRGPRSRPASRARRRRRRT